MTPEQFMDCRLALRALRRVKRWRDFNIPVATGDFESVIYRGKRDLPEYRAMMEAKRSVREAQTLVDRVRVGASIITTEAVAQSMWGDRRREYRKAREMFIERIGGEG